MRKKSLLALLMAVMLMMSGCALVTVDEDADNARVIVDVNGETVNKLTIKNVVANVIEQNQSMNQLYQMMGMEAQFSTDQATVTQQVIDSYVSNLVQVQKAKELKLDVMTEEEQAAIDQQAEENYQNYLKQIASTFLPNSTLEGDELTAAAEKYAADNGLSSKEEFVKNATDSKLVEKLQASVTDLVTVEEDELKAAYEAQVESEKTAYAENPDQYGTSVNGGATAYYAPDGYRQIKHILVKASSAESEEVTAKQAAADEAKAALDNAGGGADTAALQAALDEANNALADARMAAALSKAQEVYALATAEGADFDALMKEYNEDTGEPEKGYVIRTGFGAFVPEFTAAGMALEKVGDVSEPVESTYGYHIIQYTADVPEGEVGLDAVREELTDSTLTAKKNEALSAALTEWISAANAKTYVDRMN